MKDIIVSVHHLSQCYINHWAVRDLSFDIPACGITGLLGANGAGKSTVMNMICGVLSPTMGEVYINGVNLRTHPEEARRYVGFLPQQPPLYGDMTVCEYLTHCAHLHLMKATDVPGAVKQVMGKCAIAHFSHRLIKSLSGGYQQRVGIAQAIVHNPPFVVLDEPTNGLDPNQIVDVRNLIRDIATEHAVLLSTHILPEVEATCNEIRMIREGKLVFSGSMEEFNDYIVPSGFQIEFSGDESKAAQILSTIQEANVSKMGNNCFRVTVEHCEGVAQTVIEMTVREGLSIRELIVERCSLNEVFARLSGKSK